MNTILFATDLSDNSKNAWNVSKNICKTFGSNLIVLNIFDIPTILGSPEGLDFKEMDQKIIDKKREELNLFCSTNELKEDFKNRIEFQITEGSSPGHEILKAAENIRPEMIIIGTKGHSNLKHVLLGSTAKDVIEKSSFPVLVVPSDSILSF
jgi:nucleotide-binding universal stress UspA family protein